MTKKNRLARYNIPELQFLSLELWNSAPLFSGIELPWRILKLSMWLDFTAFNIGDMYGVDDSASG